MMSKSTLKTRVKIPRKPPDASLMHDSSWDVLKPLPTLLTPQYWEQRNEDRQKNFDKANRWRYDLVRICEQARIQGRHSLPWCDVCQSHSGYLVITDGDVSICSQCIDAACDSKLSERLTDMGVR